MVDRGNANKWTHHLNSVVDERVKFTAPIEKKSYLPETFQPSNWSVLCGRGRENYDSIGNRRFKLLIDIYFVKYTTAKSRTDKSCIVMEIVDTVRAGAGAERGGFVKWDASQERWYEVGDDIAREKVGNQFRVAISAASKSKSCSKVKKGGKKGTSGSKKTKRPTAAKTTKDRDEDHEEGETEGASSSSSHNRSSKRRRTTRSATASASTSAQEDDLTLYPADDGHPETSFRDASMSPDVVSSSMIDAPTCGSIAPDVHASSSSSPFAVMTPAKTTTMMPREVSVSSSSSSCATPAAAADDDDEEPMPLLPVLPNPTPLQKMKISSSSPPVATIPYSNEDATSIVSEEDDGDDGDDRSVDTQAFMLDLFGLESTTMSGDMMVH